MQNKVKAKKAKPTATRRGRKSTSRISSQNQVTLPVDILRALGLEAGDEVTFELTENQAVLKKIDEGTHPLARLIATGENIYQDFDLEKERNQMWPE